jgi:hypothetical protein
MGRLTTITLSHWTVFLKQHCNLVMPLMHTIWGAWSPPPLMPPSSLRVSIMIFFYPLQEKINVTVDWFYCCPKGRKINSERNTHAKLESKQVIQECNVWQILRDVTVTGALTFGPKYCPPWTLQPTTLNDHFAVPFGIAAKLSMLLPLELRTQLLL